MPITFTSKWQNYTTYIEEIRRLKVQSELFPDRTSTREKIKVAEKELISDYTSFINMNNSLQESVLENTVTDWFESNCRMKNKTEVERWLEQHKPAPKSVYDAVDDLVGAKLCQLCFPNGGRFCPQVKGDETGCATQLAQDIVKTSVGYTTIKESPENINLFLSGSSSMIKTETIAQESFESPIEKIMFTALKPVIKKLGLSLEREYPIRYEGRFEIMYSLDIVILDKNTNKIILCIETDGLRYHSGFQSMTSDRQRDRYLLTKGIPTMRFTSKDIFRNVDSCVAEVESALYALTGLRKRK